MPYIKEEDLLDLYSESDKLIKDKKELQDGYIALKLKSVEGRKKNRIYKAVIIGLLLLSLVTLLFWFFNYKKTSKVVQETEIQKIILQDSIQKLSSGIQEPEFSIDSKKLIYFVQIGNFKETDLFKESKYVSNFQQIKHPKYNTYLVGGFYTYIEATNFKNQIKKIGIKDAFLVAYKDKKKIHIREALKLSNETEYLD